VNDELPREPYPKGVPPALLGFAIGIAFLVPIAARSGLTLGHVLIICLAPVSLASAWRYRATRYLMAVEASWLVVAALTDHLHGVGLHVSYITLMRPVLLFLTYCGFIWLLQVSRRHALAAATGFAVGIIGSSALYQVGNFWLDPWKYALGDPVSLALVGCAGWALMRHRRALALGLVGVALTLNLVLGFRSEAGVVLIAAVIGSLAGRGRKRTSRWKLKLGLVLSAVALVGYPVYGMLASSGHLGYEQQYKWARQSQVTGGALIGARPEFVAASVIIGQSPVIGQGTGFSVDVTTQERFLQELDALGVSVGSEGTFFFFGQGVDLHSALFQTWAESGALALPAMILPWCLVMAAVGAALRRGSRGLALIFGMFAAQFFWDFLFSPWPRLGPSILGFAVAAAVVYRSERPEVLGEATAPRVLALTS
jgi:hypothetical protein